MRNKASKNRKERLLIELEQYTEKHLDLAKSVLQAANSQLYVLDFLAVGAIHRSINLIKGFCDFVKSNNFICASSLLRLQLDTCLRFFASFLVDDPHKFAFNLMKGKHVNKQKDKCGKLMTDSYLAKKLSEIHPWVTKLYKQASGYIHLSEMHIFNVIRAKSDEEISAELIIGEGDSFVSDNDYINLIIAFKLTTDLFLEYMSGWKFTKDNVELVKTVKNKFEEKYGRSPDYKDMIKFDFKEKENNNKNNIQ